jgi:tRNA C32,U32 (ribose-2'-O)-methylase TrmJ
MIPMQGQLASLNVSVAAGMFLYEVTRQRKRSVVEEKTQVPIPITIGTKSQIPKSKEIQNCQSEIL